MATQKEVNAFIKRLVPIAQELRNSRERWILPSITIAQAALESAWGTSPAMAKANGLFGFKVGSGTRWGDAWKGASYSTKTKEYYGSYVSIVDNFRAYDTVADAVKDYMDLLCNSSRYKGAVNNPDPLSAITAIKNGGYATSPTYIQNIMSVIKKYNLTQYDTLNTDKADYFPKYTGRSRSIVDALNSLGIQSSLAYREQLAFANDISRADNYKMNETLLILLKAGRLRRV